MRRLASWSFSITDADAAFAGLVTAFASDPYTRVMHRDARLRELNVEGQGWYHGELTVRDGLATLTVFSKKTGASRVLWWLPERQGMRFAKRHFADAVAALPQPV